MASSQPTNSFTGHPEVLVYTSVTRSYLPKAKVLATSLKRQHPDWQFAVLLSDLLPAGWDPLDWPFDHVLLLPELGIPHWRSWAFGHSIVELCTAVKGRGALELIDQLRPEKIIYLDPDIWVQGSLAPLADLLDEHAVLLTPHLLDPEASPAAIVDNEICTLKHGTYNLGFYAATTGGQGREFISWWAARLQEYCLADIPGGLFTDQRWCDLAPCFFDRLHIVRDRGCNVATWNVAHRRLTRSPAGTWLAGGVPLRFYHFTGYDSGDGRGILTRSAADQPDAFRLWDEYGAALEAAGHGQPRFRDWEYARFSNGEPISADMRRLYRSRPDLQAAFPDPYKVEGLHCYYEWWQAEVGGGRIAQAPTPTTQPHRSPLRAVIGGMAVRARAGIGLVRRGLLAGDVRVLAPSLAVLVACATVLLALVGLGRHFTAVPSWDMWDGGLRFFIDSGDPKAWWAAHNEHRILLARGLFWLDYRFLGGTGAPLVALNYLMLAMFAAVWVVVLRRAPGLARWQWIVLAAALVAWCFQWMQNGNMIWPFQVQFFLAYLLPLLSFLALGRSAAKGRLLPFQAAAVGGLMSVGTMANGLFALPLLTVMAAVLRCGRLRVAWLAILAGLSWAVYLHQMRAVTEAGQGSTVGLLLESPWSFVGYVLLFLGSPFYHWAGGGGTGFALGVAAGLAACGWVIWLAWRASRTETAEGLPRGVDSALVFFAFYVIASGVATGLGRFDSANLEEAATYRYTTPAIMLWAALFCGVIRTGLWGGLRHSGPVWALLVLAACALLNRQFDAVRWPNNHVFERAVGGLALALGAEDDEAVVAVYPRPRVVHRSVARARSAGLSIFGRPPFSAAAELQDWRDQAAALPACEGNVDRVDAVGSRFVRIDGWAMAPGGEQPSWGRVVDPEGRVVGTVVFGGLRPDVAAVHGGPGRYSGFSGYLLAGTNSFSIILMGRVPLARFDAR